MDVEKPIHEMNFEEAVALLERVVAELESGNHAHWRMRCSCLRPAKSWLRRCNKQLDDAALRVEQLTADGEIVEAGRHRNRSIFDQCYTSRNSTSCAYTAARRNEQNALSIASCKKENGTLFKSLRESLTRTRNSVFGQIANVLGTGDIDEETWEDLEALLVQADMGVPTTLQIVDNLQERVRKDGLYRADQLFEALKTELRDILTDPPPFELEAPRQLTVGDGRRGQRLRQDDDDWEIGAAVQR
jgi:exonuclease VII small subunit